MDQKVDSEFLQTPSRQSPAAILIILSQFLRILIRQGWPLLLIIIFSPGSRWEIYLYVLFIGGGAMSAVFSIIAYLRFYYSVEGGEIVIQKGIFLRKRLNIPFERIQTINLNQTIIHQLFDVVALEIDTAGSAFKELSIMALTRPKAERIRDYLLEQVAVQEQANLAETSLPDAAVEVATPQKVLLELDIPDLVKIGIGQNHLRGLGVLLAFGYGIFEILEDTMGKAFQEYLKSIDIEDAVVGGNWFLALLPFILLIALGISIVNTVIRFYDLKFYQTRKGFKLIAGLFTRTERTANLQKIQMIEWGTNPIKKVFKLFDLRLSQASSAALGNAQSIYVPGCYTDQVKAIRGAYFPEESDLVFHSAKVDPVIIQRRTLYFGLLPALLMTGLRLNWAGVWAFPWLLWLPVFWWIATQYFKRWTFHISADGLRIEKGWLFKRSILLKWSKVQTIRLITTPFQRRKGLTNIRFHTAGGSVTILYIPMETAVPLKNYVLYRVETHQGKWM